MKYKKIVIAGGGILGSQIAFQAAYCGFDVTIWLRSEGSIGRTLPKLKSVKKSYKDAIKLMDSKNGKTPGNWSLGIADPKGFNAKKCLDKVEKAADSIKIELDMKKAMENADLVIEAMAEDKDQKTAFYKKLAPFLPKKTVVVTNSSTLLPSKFAKATDRPEKFLSLHFANAIWKNNTAEVMVHPGTKERYFKEVMEFAEDIRMVALPVKKEKSGYLLNSMLVPLLFSALDLYVNGISDPESIDTAWKRGTGAPHGPFEILDVVGLQTAYNIVLMYVKIPKIIAPYNFKGIAACLDEMIKAGKLGKAAGEGFYKYKK